MRCVQVGHLTIIYSCERFMSKLIGFVKKNCSINFSKFQIIVYSSTLDYGDHCHSRATARRAAEDE